MANPTKAARENPQAEPRGGFVIFRTLPSVFRGPKDSTLSAIFPETRCGVKRGRRQSGPARGAIGGEPHWSFGVEQ